MHSLFGGKRKLVSRGTLALPFVRWNDKQQSNTLHPSEHAACSMNRLLCICARVEQNLLAHSKIEMRFFLLCAQRVKTKKMKINDLLKCSKALLQFSLTNSSFPCVNASAADILPHKRENS
jgi:hypothetical protein